MGHYDDFLNEAYADVRAREAAPSRSLLGSALRGASLGVAGTPSETIPQMAAEFVGGIPTYLAASAVGGAPVAAGLRALRVPAIAARAAPIAQVAIGTGIGAAQGAATEGAAGVLPGAVWGGASDVAGLALMKAYRGFMSARTPAEQAIAFRELQAVMPKAPDVSMTRLGVPPAAVPPGAPPGPPGPPGAPPPPIPRVSGPRTTEDIMRGLSPRGTLPGQQRDLGAGFAEPPIMPRPGAPGAPGGLSGALELEDTLTRMDQRTAKVGMVPDPATNGVSATAIPEVVPRGGVGGFTGEEPGLPGGKLRVPVQLELPTGQLDLPIIPRTPVTLNDVNIRNRDLPDTRLEYDQRIAASRIIPDSDFPWTGFSPEFHRDIQNIAETGHRAGKLAGMARKAGQGELPTSNFVSTVDEDGMLQFYPKTSKVDDIMMNWRKYVEEKQIALPLPKEQMHFMGEQFRSPSQNFFKRQVDDYMAGLESTRTSNLLKLPEEEVERLLAQPPKEMFRMFSARYTPQGQELDDLMKAARINPDDYLAFQQRMGPRQNRGNTLAWLRSRCGY